MLFPFSNQLQQPQCMYTEMPASQWPAGLFGSGAPSVNVNRRRRPLVAPNTCDQAKRRAASPQRQPARPSAPTRYEVEQVDDGFIVSIPLPGFSKEDVR